MRWGGRSSHKWKQRNSQQRPRENKGYYRVPGSQPVSSHRPFAHTTSPAVLSTSLPGFFDLSYCPAAILQKRWQHWARKCLYGPGIDLNSQQASSHGIPGRTLGVRYYGPFCRLAHQASWRSSNRLYQRHVALGTTWHKGILKTWRFPSLPLVQGSAKLLPHPSSSQVLQVRGSGEQRIREGVASSDLLPRDCQDLRPLGLPDAQRAALRGAQARQGRRAAPTQDSGAHSETPSALEVRMQH